MFISSPFPWAFPCLSLNKCYPWLLCFNALVYIPIIQGYTTTMHPEPNVRLIDPALINSHEGQIEVKIAGQWGPICGMDVGLYEADMFCRQLGYSLGAEEFYSDAGAEFGTNTYYSNVFYLGLSCDSGNENDINECSYNQLVAPTETCSRTFSSYYGGVTCDTGSGSNDDEYNLGWIIVILVIFLGYFIYRVKQKGLPSCNTSCTDSTSTRNPEVITEEPSTTVPLNVVLNQEPPRPFTDDPALPVEDNPPRYDAVVPPKDGTPSSYPQGCPYPPQNGDASYPPQGATGAPYPIGGAGAPYPPQLAGTPYPPPVAGPTYPSRGAAPYPLQDSNSAFPPQNAGTPYPTQNHVFPPAGYIPDASNDAVPLTPPPSYDSLSTDQAS